jgi:D-aminopeptidase
VERTSDLAGLIPGVTRVAATTVRRELADAAELVGLTTVLSALGDAAAANAMRISS